MKTRALVCLLGLLAASMALEDRMPQARAQSGQGGTATSAGPPPGASAAERDRWLGEHITALIAERDGLATVRIGIFVADAASGRILYQRDGTAAYSVASCAKLITAAAALALLGPDFRPTTTVLAEEIDDKGVVRGDLYLRGRADPGLGVRDLDTLAEQVALAGVTAVRGRLIIDDTYFDAEITPPHFDEQPKENASFRAPVSALSLSFSSFAVVVRPARSGRGPAEATLDPPGDYARIVQNALVTQKSGRNRVRMKSEVNDKDGRVEITLSGQLRADRGPRRYSQRVPDPFLYAATLFRDALARRQIRVRNRTAARGATSDKARVIAGIEGSPMAVLVRGMGKYSNNYVAETLLKTIGAETRSQPGPASWQDGLTAVRGFLASQAGLAAGSYRYDNGSGLFDATALSPAQLVAVLLSAYRDPHYFPDFIASLSIAGVDGTLRSRLRRTRATGLVRAKTGTLARVSSLAGYASVAGKQPLVFAVVVNDLPDRGRDARRTKRQARDLQNRVARALVRYLDESDQGAAEPELEFEPEFEPDELE